nr:RNA methyltransferase [Cellulomonas hominis]
MTDPADERLADYVALTDVALRSRHEPAKGLYIAESSTVLGRALAAGHRPRSVLVSPRWLPDLEAMLTSRDPGDPPVRVYVAEPAVLEAITGFHVHRGALAAMHRPPLPPVAEVLAGARRVAVLEDVVDHTNVGAYLPISQQPPSRVVVFEDLVDHTNLGAGIRACAALNADAFLVTPRCADPLYRRSVRVSMGTVFQVPWTRIDSWPQGGMDELKAAGYTVAALALSASAVSLDDFEQDLPDRLALVVGTEGHGLKPETLEHADVTVKIPMGGGVDSLNVASALAVALWGTRIRTR